MNRSQLQPTRRSTGRRYNPQRHMSLLVEDWVSKAAAMQVRVRAWAVLTKLGGSN